MPHDIRYLLPNKYPDKLIYIYISATALLENRWYYGVLLENERQFFNLVFDCIKACFYLDVLNKKTICLK